MTIRLKYAPRVYAWTDVVDNLSDQVCAEDGWMSVNDVRDVLDPLLTRALENSG